MLMLKYNSMKRRSTTPVSTSFTTKAVLVAASVLMAVSAPMMVARTVGADNFDEKIAAVQKKIDEYNAQASKLADKRETLENQLAKLNNEKARIQAQIDLSEAKAKKLADQITKSELQIAQNQDALGSLMADIALDEDVSTIEMLASSDNIGDFLDKQTYQATVQQNLTDTIKKINKLKDRLQKQKKDVEEILAGQRRARSALAAKEAEKAQLISQTKGQESAFQKLSSKAKKERAELQRQQQAAIAAASGGNEIYLGGGGAGGYPWGSGCYVDQYLYSHGGPNGDGTDPLGYACRQCTSYAAYKVLQHTGRAYRWLGNANMWPNSFSNKGSTPRANSVGVISSGQYGHVVWIDSVNGDGTVNISQYNYYNAGGPGWGHFSQMKVPASTYDTYIYF